MHLGTPAGMWGSTSVDVAPITYALPSATEGCIIMGSAGRTLRWLAFGSVGAPLAVLCCSPQLSLCRPQLCCGRWSLPLARGGVTLFWVFCESGYLSFFGGEVYGELTPSGDCSDFGRISGWGTIVAPLRVGLACVVHMCT